MLTAKNLMLSLVTAGLLATTTTAVAAPRSFAVNEKGGSRVTFESDAPVENIVGVTTTVRGTLEADFGALDRSTARVVVDLTTVKTGIDKRDAHMRSADFLNTSKYPTALFQLERLESKGDPRARGGATAIGIGTITIKGKSQQVRVPVKLQYRSLDAQLRKLGFKGDVLRVTGSFQLKLSDFGIKVPGMLGQKVSNDITITLALTAEDK